jgi:putative intracellular protease/amidase
MQWKKLAAGALLAFSTLGAVGAIAFYSLPAVATGAVPPAISAKEQAVTLAALKPPKRSRPVIAVIGTNEGTETTDYLVPYGVLKRSGIADVYALSARAGPMRMMPALIIEADATMAEFDALYPEGADYVIVPALHESDDPATIAWIKSQAGRGAIIVGICTGAKVLGEAGLLKGRRATAHWYDLPGVQDANPTMLHVRDRRFVVDRGVATTTGISASVPMALTLVEAISGHESAQTLAQELGIDHWDARHDSGSFTASRDFYGAAIGNLAAFWRHEHIGIKLTEGIDEISLGLAADSWSRTYRSQAVTFAETNAPVRSRSGLRIIADQKSSNMASGVPLRTIAHSYPIQAFEAELNAIGARYGQRTRAFVALQLEYPQHRRAK